MQTNELKKGGCHVVTCVSLNARARVLDKSLKIAFT
jgi:hypothetical protein